MWCPCWATAKSPFRWRWRKSRRATGRKKSTCRTSKRSAVRSTRTQATILQTSSGAGAMRIGILGSGLMGGKLGTLFARAGHEVTFSYARSEEKLKTLAQEAKARYG